jgi:hypothetical protein
MQDIAESLLALTKIVERTPRLLDELLEDASVDRVEIYLDELKSGSLFERAAFKFFFKSQKEFDSFFRTGGKKLGVDALKKNKKAIPYLILCAVLMGGIYAIRRGVGDKDRTVQVENHATQMIQITAGTLNMEPSDLKDVLVRVLKDNNDLARDAVKFVRPAKREQGASITLDDDDSSSLTSQVVNSFPKELHELPAPEFVEEHHGIEVQIRAVDLDSTKKGWAAKIPAISEARVKLQLAPFMDGTELMEKKVVHGDVTAVFEVQEDGSRVPRLYYLSDYEGQRKPPTAASEPSPSK